MVVFDRFRQESRATVAMLAPAVHIMHQVSIPNYCGPIEEACFLESRILSSQKKVLSDYRGFWAGFRKLAEK